MRLTPITAAFLLLAGCATGDDADPGTDAQPGPDARTDATPGPDAAPGPDATPGPDAAPEPDAAPGPDATTALPYPTRDPQRLKGLQPDFWADQDEISGNQAGGVAMNLVWSAWEPSVTAPPCDPITQEELDGHCFTVDAAVDAAIADWTDRGLVVTAVVYGVPEWARQAVACSPVSPGFEIFCAPDDPADYGRFAGMIARRYDGLHGHGRIADFVVHNEVNANDWFDVGCGQGTPCDPDTWIQAYADCWAAAYDAVTLEQPFAKVLTSFTHHFDTAFDQPAAESPLLSVKTFLAGFAPRVAPRPWRVAYHPYPPDLLSPAFSPDDLPRVTYGNLGVLVQWLAQTFPGVPSAHSIQLTESGINSLAPGSSEAAQATAVCDTLRNVLGTPGIESYIYHRMSDHPVEVAAGLGLGLRRTDGTAKPAWAVWALANRFDLDPPDLDCGFEDLPYTRLTRSYHATRGHWASSRVAPAGFTAEQSWHLERAPQAGTVPLHECAHLQHNLLSLDLGCEGLQPLGPVGHLYAAPGVGTVALYRCRVGSGTDHLVSPDPACEGQTFESLLGYALP